MTNTTYQVKCKKCREYNFIFANPADVNKWLDGTPIHVAFPYLTPDDLFLLESSICAECYLKEVDAK